MHTYQIISRARQNQQMNVRDFAAALDVSYSAVSLWELGKCEISTARLLIWKDDPRAWVREMALAILDNYIATLTA